MNNMFEEQRKKCLKDEKRISNMGKFEKFLNKLYFYFSGKCLKCGNIKHDWRGADVCIEHGLLHND